MQFDRQFSRVFMSLSSGLERGQLQLREGHWAWACPAGPSCLAVTLCPAISFPGQRSHGSQEAISHFSTELQTRFPVSMHTGSFSGKEPACYCRRHKRRGLDPWVRKIPQRRKWQPTPAFLPGESHGQRSLVGYSPGGHKEQDMTEQLNTKYFINIKMGQIFHAVL